MSMSPQYTPYAYTRQPDYDIRDSLHLPEFVRSVIMSMVDQNGFAISTNFLTEDEIQFLCHSFENSNRQIYMADADPSILLVVPNDRVKAEKKGMSTKDFKGIQREKFLIRQAKKNGDDLCCSICLEKFKSCTMVAKTSCNHRFHVNCLKQYFCHHGATCCPICRTEQVVQ